jgi:hypothetical protein
MASGALMSAAVFALTLLVLAVFGGGVDPGLLAGVLFGYSITVQGAFIGAMWGYAWGFVFGAIFAFAYNIAVIPPAPPLVDWDAAEPGEEG